MFAMSLALLLEELISVPGSHVAEMAWVAAGFLSLLAQFGNNAWSWKWKDLGKHLLS